ncbi:MAG: dihydropteroate synthase [Candidatus Latescibacterota bacterium]|nr:MAG: dihydropteroate synthase [Candidatus Latescibacterota bacterium]
MQSMRYPLRLITARDRGTVERYFAEAGVDPYGVDVIAGKTEIVVVRVDGVPAPAANIMKQQLLSLGADAAVHRAAITGGPDRSTVYIVADRNRLALLPAKLSRQPFGLPELGEAVERLAAAAFSPPRPVRLPGGELDLSAGPVVMGILNVTPDSFSDGGSYVDPGRAAERALAMAEEGAGVVDVGGESTRPGAAPVSVEEEIARVKPVLERLAGRLPVPLSIDTRRSEVARVALDLGASIINDVTGLVGDPAMAGLASDRGAAVVVMHMLGTPETMQIDPRYDDVTGEILAWLGSRTAELVASGVKPESIIVDPGIGFGKRLEHNLALLAEIGDLRGLGFPVMVGFSRKACIGGVTGRGAADRLAGGLAALGRCCEAGVGLVRVHDVRETVDYIKVRRAIERTESVR